MKFSIKDYLSKYDQMFSFLRIWSHLLKKSIKENLISYAVCSIEEALDSDVQHFLTVFFRYFLLRNI